MASVEMKNNVQTAAESIATLSDLISLAVASKTWQGIRFAAAEL